ncbi:MAG: SDR family oxidoreductase [Parachlamydiales bacterium]|jgi:citronellol/citronellal dehydrogenase
MKNKTVMITGSSQGIGLAIALRFAQEGWNIVIISKDASSVIAKAVDQIKTTGGRALSYAVDVSDVKQFQEISSEAVSHFGSLDVLINNTSATIFSDTLNTTPAQFDSVISTSVRAAIFLSQACIPSLKNSDNPHIINISPPLNMESQWFKDHLAFSIAKYSMSMCTLGMSAEFLPYGIAVNSLWPQTTIATQTIKDHCIPEVYTASRWPSIMGDAAYEIVRKTKQEWTGHFFTDEEVLRKVGKTDFSHYAVDPHAPLMQPLFIPLKKGMKHITREMFLLKKT